MKVFDFYLELNPVEILHSKERTFSENLILLVYLFLISLVIYRIILFAVDTIKPAENSQAQYNRRKIGRTIFATVFTISFLPLIFSSLNFLPTVMGLAAAGIVISLKEVWLNIVGWFVILGSNGFKVGDRIEIDHVMGDVVNIGLTKFSLVEINPEHGFEQSTNRLVHFPNHHVIIQRYYVVSEKMNFVWDEFRFSLSVDSDWAKAEEICNGILKTELILAPEVIEDKIKELSKNYLLRLGKRTPIVYTVLDKGLIVFSLRYLTPIRSKRMNRIIISKALLTAFKNEPAIKFEEPK
ncbi:mechanosensitive ion channel family protein [Leptospira sp. GIMC2001]|uniref:mechanosensitive ion channel family protein n=1 Tax=Leptospira sp. GIMC2001 TaxID=1513297 RepID=UPI002349BEC6|nr:mechanosensitive ion channel domain-containing protein [Leptospira sp. GIMC2001]WCL48708.1 mechanosensitive ion channel [Leptospira sp. GIMC2001]